MDLNLAKEDDIDLLRWLKDAPNQFQEDSTATTAQFFRLAHGNERVACVLHEDFFYLSGTDLVRIIRYRFERLSGTSILHEKKFEEGIFSDTRRLLPGKDASLQETRSPFLRE